MTTQIVSAHAVTRFCQRVLDVPVITGIKSGWDEARAHCEAVPLTVDQVRTMILTPKVLAEISMGRDRIATDHFTVVVDDGVIVTVMTGGEYWKPKRRCKILGKREQHRTFQQSVRRSK